MDPVAEIVAMMLALPEWQRLEVMGNFCQGCGGIDLPCHCQNDE